MRARAGRTRAFCHCAIRCPGQAGLAGGSPELEGSLDLVSNLGFALSPPCPLPALPGGPVFPALAPYPYPSTVLHPGEREL